MVAAFRELRNLLYFYSELFSSLIRGALLYVLAVTNYRAEYRTNDRGVRKLKIVTLTFAAAGCSNWSGRALRPPRGWEPKYSLCTVEANLGSCEAMLVSTSISS